VKSLSIKDFLDDPAEVHALVIGLCEVIAFWPPRHRYQLHPDCADLDKEYHYYQLGRSLGVLFWLGLAFLIKRFFL
jgi:hypothetical protein